MSVCTESCVCVTEIDTVGSPHLTSHFDTLNTLTCCDTIQLMNALDVVIKSL